MCRQADAGKFVTFLRRAGGAGQECPRCGEDGEAASRADAQLLGPAPWLPSVPTLYPPGGKILLHAQQPLAQGLQHLCHSVSSPRVSDSRRRPRAPALGTRAPRTLAARPAPAPGPAPAQHRSPFRVRPPTDSRAFAPPLPGLRSRSEPRRAPASEKGRCYPPRRKSRGFDSFHYLNPSPPGFSL